MLKNGLLQTYFASGSKRLKYLFLMMMLIVSYLVEYILRSTFNDR